MEVLIEIAAGSFKVTDDELVHPLPSVTVAVIRPPESPVAVALDCAGVVFHE